MNNYDRILLVKYDKDLEILDDFCEFYEWEMLESEKGYNIYDFQRELILDEDFKDFSSLVSRVVSRAIDYYINEHDWCEDYIKKDYDILVKFYEIAKKYTIRNEYNINWLKFVENYINELKEEF